MMEKYFLFSPNILAVNCIHTDIQDRSNGADFDSDFFFTTNNPVMVRCAEKAYAEYPTIVNKLAESGITYNNTPEEYARMDNKFAQSQLGIGESSNLAQLAMTYYWTEPNKDLYDIFVILSVIAQVEIDSCKREYEIGGSEEIKRIKKLPCMQKYKGHDFPEFMKHTRKIQTTKNGKYLPVEDIREQRDKIYDRINDELECPMNTLVAALSGIRTMRYKRNIPTRDFFVWLKGKANDRQMGKIRKYAEQFSYDMYLINHDKQMDSFTKNELISDLLDEAVDYLSGLKISAKTMNRLVETAIGVGQGRGKQVGKKNLTLLKLLHKANPSLFLRNFVSGKNNETDGN